MLARLHEEAQLLAELSDQAAAVTWLKDGRALPPGPKYEVQALAGQQALLVRDVVRDDAGLYECISRGDRIAYQLSVQGVCVFMCVCSPGHCHSHGWLGFLCPALGRLQGIWAVGADVLSRGMGLRAGSFNPVGQWFR